MDTTELHGRSMADLTKKLSHDLSELVRKELELAKAELAAKARRAAVGIALLGAGAILLLVAVGALTAAAILALDLVLASWLSALVVGAAGCVLGAMLLLGGIKAARRATPVPTETVAAVKEDVVWLRTRAKHGAR